MQLTPRDRAPDPSTPRQLGGADAASLRHRCARVPRVRRTASPARHHHLIGRDSADPQPPAAAHQPARARARSCPSGRRGLTSTFHGTSNSWPNSVAKSATRAELRPSCVRVASREVREPSNPSPIPDSEPQNPSKRRSSAPPTCSYPNHCVEVACVHFRRSQIGASCGLYSCAASVSSRNHGFCRRSGSPFHSIFRHR